MYNSSKFISNERRELLKMALRRMLMPTPITEETVTDIFTKTPLHALFKRKMEKKLAENLELSNKNYIFALEG